MPSSTSPDAGLSARLPFAARPAVVLLAIANLAAPALASGDVEYGAYLAQECSSCHHINKDNLGIPNIVGLPMDYFIAAMTAYKEGERAHATMQSIVRSLDDEQIAALAAYYASE
jgi:cytochrome c553